MRAVTTILFALIVGSNAGLLGPILQPVLDPVARTLDAIIGIGEAQVLLQLHQEDIKDVIVAKISSFLDSESPAYVKAEKFLEAAVQSYKQFLDSLTDTKIGVLLNKRIEKLGDAIREGLVTLQCFRNEIPKITNHSKAIVNQIAAEIDKLNSIVESTVEESIGEMDQDLIDELAACNETSCPDEVVSCDRLSCCSPSFLFFLAFRTPACHFSCYQCYYEQPGFHRLRPEDHQRR